MPDKASPCRCPSCSIRSDRDQWHSQLLAVGHSRSADFGTTAKKTSSSGLLAIDRTCDDHLEEQDRPATDGYMTLVETVPVTTPRDVARRAVSRVSGPHNDPAALEAVLVELCLNVKQWAEAAGQVFVEMDEDHFVITVQDDGVGIPVTMRTAFPELNNEDAVAQDRVEPSSPMPPRQRRPPTDHLPEGCTPKSVMPRVWGIW